MFILLIGGGLRFVKKTYRWHLGTGNINGPENKITAISILKEALKGSYIPHYGLQPCCDESAS